jgi:hypothetical protein
LILTMTAACALRIGSRPTWRPRLPLHAPEDAFPLETIK